MPEPLVDQPISLNSTRKEDLVFKIENKSWHILDFYGSTQNVSSEDKPRIVGLCLDELLGQTSHPIKKRLVAGNSPMVSYLVDPIVIKSHSYSLSLVKISEIESLIILTDTKEDFTSRTKVEESEQKFKDVFKSMVDAYYKTDSERRFQIISPSIERIVGIKPEKFLGKKTSEFVKPEKANEIFDRLKETGMVEDFRVNFKFPGGALKVLSFNIAAEFNDKKQITGTHGIIRDITKQALFEQEIIASESKFKEIFDSISDIYYRSDSNRRVEIISPSVETIMGYTPEEVLGKSEKKFYKDPKENDALYQHLMEKGSIKNVHGELIKKNNEVVNVSLTASANYDHKGNFIGINGLIRDISREKKQSRLTQLNRDILEKIATEGNLKEILNFACLGIEEIFPGMISSVLFYDDKNKWLTDGIGPSLPHHYMAAVNEFPIGPKNGSCGTAAYRKEEVIVCDIENNPLWESYAHIALDIGLRACWSIPVLSSERNLIGTFAIYYKEVRDPTRLELETIYSVCHLISIAIENSRNKEALVTNEERNRLFLDNSPIGVIIHDSNVIRYVNKEMLSIAGAKDKEELVGMKVMSLVPGKYKKPIEKRLKEAIKTTQLIPRLEQKLLRLDQSLIDVEVMGIPIDFQGERLIQSVFIDIAERKKVEKELIASEERYRSLNESIFDAIIISDDTGRIVSWNKAAEKMFGYSAGEIIAQDVSVIIPKKHLQQHKEGFEKFSASRRKSVMKGIYELNGKHKDDSIFPVEISMANWKSDGQNFFSALIRDISERKAAEEKQTRLNEFLIKQNKQLEEFAHIASHNLRAPIANIYSLLQLYEMDNSPENSTFVMKQLNNMSENLSETINELTEVIKTSWELNKQKQSLSFAETLARVKQTMSSDIKHKDAIIEDRFDTKPKIFYPKVYLESIMQNLLSNALKYNHPKRVPKVIFETSIDDKNVILSVKDNGLGIDLKQFGDKLFGLRKTFHNNENARGVGLFITKAQIESMGGTINVKSRVNSGTEFIVNFGRIQSD